MGKVVTSKGLNEFIESGKTESITPDKPPEKKPDAPPLEVVRDKPVVDVGTKEPPKAEEDIYSEEDQETKEEITKAKRFDALMRKKHRQMKEAQEAAAENDRLAESQFNRARLAEQKLAETETELRKLREQSTAKPTIPEAKEPDPKDYTDDKGQFKAFEYAKDLAAYSAKTAVENDRKAQEKARREAESVEAFRLAETRIAKSIEKYPDYKEVLAASDVKTHQTVLDYLSASESIGEVSYYMAKHPEFVERINKLHPLKAIAEVGKLELTFEKPPEPAKQEQPVVPPRAVSGAPPPIVPLDTSESVNTITDPAKMNFKQLRAYERARQKKR